jgi:hypothetical protein
MNYKAAHKRALEHMRDNCNACIHAFVCDKCMDEKHALKWFTELDQDGRYWCRVCPQYRHGASCEKEEFIPWAVYERT